MCKENLFHFIINIIIIIITIIISSCAKHFVLLVCFIIFCCKSDCKCFCHIFIVHHITTDGLPPQWPNHLVGVVVKASASRVTDLGFDYFPACAGLFQVESYLCLPFLLACVIGSALRLVGLVSEYCDWVR